MDNKEERQAGQQFFGSSRYGAANLSASAAAAVSSYRHRQLVFLFWAYPSILGLSFYFGLIFLFWAYLSILGLSFYSGFAANLIISCCEEHLLPSTMQGGIPERRRSYPELSETADDKSEEMMDFENMVRASLFFNFYCLDRCRRR